MYFFWKHYPSKRIPKPNYLKQHIFSQWYTDLNGDIEIDTCMGTNLVYNIDPIDFDKYIKNISFNNREIFMMYNKAILFAKDKYKEYNLQLAQQILTESNPSQVKKLGRKIKGFDTDIWNLWKYKIVVNGNYLQFSQNKYMEDILLATGNKILVEASPYDRIWGIGISAKQALDNKSKWGENLLGKALMEVRGMLNN